MSFVISHKVPIHITATADEALSDANKLEAGTKFGVTDTDEFEEEKFLNSPGYSENVPVWSSLSGSIEGKRKTGSATQEVMANAKKTRTPFFIHVISNPTAAAGSKGLRYEVYAESDEKNFEAGTAQSFNYPLKFNGAPVPI
ncbi:hypothetical protein [Vitiosangium sp. GDMCC 1.1324]|uniref:hypothetical protein n=1 Tax=Vitiosangium sp. (strain GDMCC 1.1324) TaxID=2138576 RepID=UPI000D3A320B|nr:hypothetical protein [Vitiosangium sp. GDMCC 1.1324]PTL79090.1 hypothetical protein DAT35_36385 [Vitiosangium sp. GDMCC 1.1324]